MGCWVLGIRNGAEKEQALASKEVADDFERQCAPGECKIISRPDRMETRKNSSAKLDCTNGDTIYA